MAVNIATLNVNGLRDANKRMGFVHWLCHLSFDIVCLQEVHALSLDECSSWFQSFGFSSLISPGSNHVRGTVVLCKSSFSQTLFVIQMVVLSRAVSHFGTRPLA